MWKWNQIFALFCLVPTGQANVNKISTLGDYMTLKVLERIDNLLMGMERNQESILSNQNNCNKSLPQLKDSTNNH
ncbi:uncharacterized protein [Drosophila takahashii]|uniref:uncharacterized protein isoform X3 n=1 Tax=Drosophila takahashii TaxID=29030 RepID=UPI003898E816